MEFESPDVEKDFPGLYASETGKKSTESDCKLLNLINQHVDINEISIFDLHIWKFL